MIAPLPPSVREKIAQNSHPGLALDKYGETWDPQSSSFGNLQEKVQHPIVDKVVALSNSCNSDGFFAELLSRRDEMLASLQALRFTAVTQGPLTLHLSRSSALENAGLCLHPLYGFVYLPGSGLKGMARAYAQTVWLPGQTKHEASRLIMQDVFGNEPGRREFRAGKVVFHEGWPSHWPRLSTDIVNNHHSGYYGGSEDPGDWENPVPVFFLSVVAGSRFSFALNLRRADEEKALLELAYQWLLGALCHLGVGAKTNAGYGLFRPTEGVVPALPSENRRIFETEIELMTPAFLAGASQKREDCELRSATLRGLLRWWWRTMHAGHTDRVSLRSMESAIWGDTKVSGGVKIDVFPPTKTSPYLFDFKDRFKPKPDFKNQNELQSPPGNKTSQGLFYLSYGMDDSGRKRWCMPPNVKWSVRFMARDVIIGGSQIPAAELLLQAKSALWLLCQYGGIGAKCRKGFGTICCSIGDLNLQKIRLDSDAFRKKSGSHLQEIAESPSPALKAMLSFEKPTHWKNYWYALDQIGFAAQSIAQEFKHNNAKKALGLPRRIGHPARGFFSTPKGDRHSSPVHFHLAMQPDGTLTVRVSAFPSAYLPDYNASRQFLNTYLTKLRAALDDRAKDLTRGKKPAYIPSASGGVSHPTSTGFEQKQIPKASERVEAELLADKTNKGGWKAQHVASGIKGSIVNPKDVPDNLKPGDKLQLIVTSANPREINFRFPTPADNKPASSPGGKQPVKGFAPKGGGHHGGWNRKGR